MSDATTFADVARRRSAEAACALDFRVYGDGEPGEFMGHRVEAVPHAERCVFVAAGEAPCSFDYDPHPDPWAAPADEALYEGTGIALLYGIPGGEAHAHRLEGWVVRRAS